jgi:hypothetical protein
VDTFDLSGRRTDLIRINKRQSFPFERQSAAKRIAIQGY